MRTRFSSGQLEHALAQLPRPLRALLTTCTADAPPEEKRHDVDGDVTTRLGRLESRIELLADTVSELAHGLEASPLDEPNGERAAKAASSVRRRLLDRGSVTVTVHEQAEATAVP